MANNTIMTAKSTFGDGLLMDFAPDNTQATCLTHALNATLVTMNGNELSLQNDMGNGRVETAYLPEGYVPVGTCEFGGIIYIVSYNPIINKSLIGCFPSPERNISSEEIGGTNAIFTESDFLDGDKVKNTTVKKVIYSNDLNPGDKFIVYANNLKVNSDAITDFGNTSHVLGAFPKDIKFSVVAIEDSGKINYLNSKLKWYESTDGDYYINSAVKLNDTLKPDIDTYRNLLNSGYSVFLSKVSGKLAILAELETVKTFDVTYLVYPVKKEDNSKTYKVYLSCNWTSENPDIYPEGIKICADETHLVINNKKEDIKLFKLPKVDRSTYNAFESTNYEFLKSKFEESFLSLIGDSKDYNYMPRKASLLMVNKLPNLNNYDINKFEKGGFRLLNGDLYSLYADDTNYHTYLDDIFVHNYFNKDILIEYGEVTISDNPICKFTVYPYMSYGYLPDLGLDITIDFSKIGTGEINITEWRYYNNDDLSTIKLGIEAYPEENKTIQGIDIIFRDNTGETATLSIKDKNSYSGTFTETIALNTDSNINLVPTKTHKGEVYLFQNPDELTDEDIKNINTLVTNGVYATDANSITKDNIKDIDFYINDAGIIYPNLLYLATIKIKYGTLDTSGEIIEEIEEKQELRWYWTNSMFNLYYYEVYDFDNLNMDVNIGILGLFSAGNDFKADTEDIKHTANLGEDNIPYYSIGYNLHKLEDQEVNMKLVPFVENNYDTFALDEETLKDVNCQIIEGKSYIKTPDESTYNDYIKLIIGLLENNNYKKPDKVEYSVDNAKNWAESLIDWFTLTSNADETTGEEIEYITVDGADAKTLSSYISLTNSMLNLYKEGINLKLSGEYYLKMNANSISNLVLNVPTYSPLISNYNDLAKYNIIGSSFNDVSPTTLTLVFKKLLNAALNSTHGHADGYYLELSGKALKKVDEFSFADGNGKEHWWNITEFIKLYSLPNIGVFMPLVRHASKITDTGRRNEVFVCNNTNFDKKTISDNWFAIWGQDAHFKDEVSFVLQNKVAYCKNNTLIYEQSSDNGGTNPIVNSSSTALLLVACQDGSYKGFNVFYRQNKYKDGDTYLVTQLFSPLLPNTQNDSATMAEIITDFLSRIYYLDTNKVAEAFILSDLAYKENSYETWQKEFIVRLIKSEGTTSENTTHASIIKDNSVNKLITISKLNLTKYLEAFQDIIEYVSVNNVIVPEDDVYKRTNVILFEYKIDYNVQNLIEAYSNRERLVYLNSDITGRVQGLYTTNGADLLYINNNNEPQESMGGIYIARMYLESKDGTYKFIRDNNLLLQTMVLDIMSNLEVVDGVLYSKNYNSGTNTYICSFSNDDLNEKLGLGFDLFLKMGDLFSIT